MGYLLSMPGRAQSPRPVVRGNRSLVRAALSTLQRHTDASPLRLDDLAVHLQVTPVRLLRAFQQEVGLSTMDVARRLRLCRAAMQLAFRHGEPISAIAFRSGYVSHEAFTRAFRRVLGCTPSAFRTNPDWSAWQRELVIPALHGLWVAPLKPVGRGPTSIGAAAAWAGLVSVVTLPAIRTLAMIHRPNTERARLEHTLGAFIAWRRERGGLSPRTHHTWNCLFPPDEALEAPATAVAVATAAKIRMSDRAVGIVPMLIGDGRYVRLRLEGPDALLGAAIMFLQHTWCPAQGLRPRHAPVLLRRVRLFPDVPEHLAVTDIHLPIHH